ncbi:glycosyltransferase family 2 protein, partial [Bacteroidota bacterium]
MNDNQSNTDENKSSESNPNLVTPQNKDDITDSTQNSNINTTKTKKFKKKVYKRGYKKNFRKDDNLSPQPSYKSNIRRKEQRIHQELSKSSDLRKIVLRNQMISVVIPLFNEEESLSELSLALKRVFESLKCNYEVIYVDDGSTDRSFSVIKDIHNKNNRFHCIKLRRNYGKSSALAAGFKTAKGDIIITMDADLQDDPEEIPELIQKINSGYDLVSGWKKVRYDPFIKKHTSKFFNFVTSRISGIKLHDFNCGLKAYKKDVIKSIKVYGEMHRYMPALAHLSGFKVTEKIVKHRARKYGVTKFGASRFLKGFL